MAWGVRWCLLLLLQVGMLGTGRLGWNMAGLGYEMTDDWACGSVRFLRTGLTNAGVW